MLSPTCKKKPRKTLSLAQWSQWRLEHPIQPGEEHKQNRKRERSTTPEDAVGPRKDRRIGSLQHDREDKKAPSKAKDEEVPIDQHVKSMDKPSLSSSIALETSQTRPKTQELSHTPVVSIADNERRKTSPSISKGEKSPGEQPTQAITRVSPSSASRLELAQTLPRPQNVSLPRVVTVTENIPGSSVTFTFPKEMLQIASTRLPGTFYPGLIVVTRTMEDLYDVNRAKLGVNAVPGDGGLVSLKWRPKIISGISDSGRNATGFGVWRNNGNGLASWPMKERARFIGLRESNTTSRGRRAQDSANEAPYPPIHATKTSIRIDDRCYIDASRKLDLTLNSNTVVVGEVSPPQLETLLILADTLETRYRDPSNYNMARWNSIREYESITTVPHNAATLAGINYDRDHLTLRRSLAEQARRERDHQNKQPTPTGPVHVLSSDLNRHPGNRKKQLTMHVPSFASGANLIPLAPSRNYGPRLPMSTPLDGLTNAAINIDSSPVSYELDAYDITDEELKRLHAEDEALLS